MPQIRHEEGDLHSEPDLAAALDATDCAIIVTDHSAYDWNEVGARVQLIVDTRHALPKR